MTALEHVVRSFARRTVQNGDVALVSDGHPALVAAFKELGWSDPYPDPLLLPPKPERDTIEVTDLTGSGAYVKAISAAPKGTR